VARPDVDSFPQICDSLTTATVIESAEDPRIPMRILMNTLAIVVSATLLAWPIAAMAQEKAQLKVLMSGGFSGAYGQLLPEFEQTSGIKVTTGSGASQGSGPQTIGAQLAGGVAADVVIMSREGLEELVAAKRIAAGTDVDLARVGLGVAVRAGMPKPDVSTVEAFKQVALAARTVSAASTSGIWLQKELFPRLGIADKVDLKIVPRGTGAAGMVADGSAAIAVMPISEILPAKGVDYAGALSQDIQFPQVFSAAIVAGSKEVDGAKRLIAFLTSARAAEAIKKSGMEPVASTR
jgi:molybdate transport system substrate-binding protein